MRVCVSTWVTFRQVLMIFMNLRKCLWTFHVNGHHTCTSRYHDLLNYGTDSLETSFTQAHDLVLMAVSFAFINSFLKNLFLTKILKLRKGNAASSGDQGKLTAIGHRLRQHCWFQRFVSYLLVAYDPLVSEEITSININKKNL